MVLCTEQGGGTPDQAGNYPIYKLTSPGWGFWDAIPGTAVRLEAGSDNLWVVQHDGNIYKYNYASGTWQLLLQYAGQDISVDPSGVPVIIYGDIPDIRGNYPIYKANSSLGASWTAIPGGAFRISVADNGDLWVIQRNGDVWQYASGSTWIFRGNPADLIGPGGGSALPDISAQGGGSGHCGCRWGCLHPQFRK